VEDRSRENTSPLVVGVDGVLFLHLVVKQMGLLEIRVLLRLVVVEDGLPDGSLVAASWLVHNLRTLKL
jgi:hypothetical protein